MVTRQTNLFLPTEKQAPADAEALSHKLVVRAGLARQVGAGLWSWLPAGWRAHQNAAQIVREEMAAIDCHEMLMPVVTPAELWKRSGRYDIDEVFKLRDRREAELILALSHEGTLTFPMARGGPPPPRGGAPAPPPGGPARAPPPRPEEGRRGGAPARRGAPHAG